MENLFVYLAKASGLLTLFFLAYYLLIKKETFFNASRLFLIGGIATAAILPLIVYTQIIWVNPVQQEPLILTHNSTGNIAAIPTEKSFEINWWYIAVTVYALGVLFFIVRLLIDLYKISRLLKGKEKIYTDSYILIDSAAVTAPFSFFRYIVYNSAMLSANELENIIVHEKVHSRQLHSLDMLLNQLNCALLWFNPICWIYKKQVAQNLEFIADAEATKNIADIKAYQKTLLKITLQPECIAITNHFYQSLIKKRIVMLNKPQSKRLNLIKFAFIIPAIAAFFYLFQTTTLAQVREVKNTQKQSEEKADIKAGYPKEAVMGSEVAYPTMAITYIDKAFTDADMKERTAMYKDIFEADVQFKNVKRNKKSEITSITVVVKDKNHTKNYPVYESISDDETPIQTFMLNIERDTKDSRNKITFQKIEQSQTNTTVTTTTDKDEVRSEILTPVEYINSRMKDRDVIIVINNEIQTSKYIDEPLGEKFESIIELDEKSTLKLFKVKAKDGAIVLTTKKIANPISAYNPSISKTGISSKTYEVVNADVNNTTNSKTTSSVRTVTVMSGSDGKIIENNTPETTYYIINKNSTNVQLNTFKEDLEKVGLKIEYSGIVRNSRGVITAINIKLEDKGNSAKSSASWDTDRNGNGIPNIYIGKIKGKLTISSAQ